MRWIVALVLAAAAAAAWADDGSWEVDRAYNPAEGALYSVKGNPDIVLQKEFLELNDYHTGSTTAVFQFHNTARGPVTVQAGFPLQIEITADPITLDANGDWVAPPDAAESDTKVARKAVDGQLQAWDFAEEIPSRYANRDREPAGQGFMAHLLDLLSVPTHTWDTGPAYASAEEEPDAWWGGSYFLDTDYPRGLVEKPAGELASLFGLRIFQDGKEVPLTSVVVDFGSGPGRLMLHFRHALSFSGSQTSIVTVSYESPTLSQTSSSLTAWYARQTTTYTWRYILDTAASWKDSLGELVLALPPGGSADLPAPFHYVGTARGRLFYEADAWEPRADQDLALSWEETTADYVSFWQNSDAEPFNPSDSPPPAGPASYMSASSALGETADVFLPWGIWKNAPFDGGRLFDGLPETAWAVRTAASGVGEWVRFRVSTPVDRLEIANGYQRSTVDYPAKDTWSFFAKNNRVKTLEIDRDDGSLVQTLELADARDLQLFNVALPVGTYRAVIRAVYRGTRYNDTCLGELSFIAGTALGFGALTRDPFLSPYVAAPARPSRAS